MKIAGLEKNILFLYILATPCNKQEIEQHEENVRS